MRTKGWYFVKLVAGQRFSDTGWVPAYSWEPAFFNPDGYSKPTWFIHNEIREEKEFVDICETELSLAVGINWDER